MSLRTMAGDGRVRPGRRAAQEMTPGAGARLLEEGLDAIDEVEAAQRQARSRVLVGHAAGGGVEQDGRVAALAGSPGRTYPDEAVVE